MYEQFGAVVDHQNKTVQFKLFFPDHTLDPNQYFKEYILPDGEKNKGGTPEIASLKVIGDFQTQTIPSGQAWDESSAPTLVPASMGKGYLYQSNPIQLKNEGFYQYKYAVTFTGSGYPTRYCNDPCTKYHSYIPIKNLVSPEPSEGDHSGFVVGGVTVLPSGQPREVTPLKGPRLPLSQLIIYELFLEDFTLEYRRNRAPLEAVMDKIDYLIDLGVNAIEIMPVNGCPNGDFTWGYNPAFHFAVTNRYANDNARELEKLSLLKNFISKLHENGIQVILDLVLNHASKQFPYFELYKDKSMSPYVSVKEEWGSMDLDFYNNCTTEFIVDLCKYWIDVFKFDGLRLDYTRGYYIANDPNHGLNKIIADLNTYIASKPELQTIAIILEHLEGYQCIHTTNIVNATGCWLDDYMWNCFRYINKFNKVDKEIIRILNSNLNFDPGKCPVTYIGDHDHSTTVKKIDDNSNFTRGEWWRTQPCMIALMTSAGAPLIYNGQEFGEVYWLPEGNEEDASGIHRVISRPLHWDYTNDQKGKDLFNIYKLLIQIRKTHPACSSPNFYPVDYSGQFNPQGYGFDYDKQVVIYHKWVTNGEKLIIVINFTNELRQVNIPFSYNGKWRDLLSGQDYTVTNYWLSNFNLPTSWGCIFTNTP